MELKKGEMSATERHINIVGFVKTFATLRSPSLCLQGSKVKWHSGQV